MISDTASSNERPSTVTEGFRTSIAYTFAPSGTHATVALRGDGLQISLRADTLQFPGAATLHRPVLPWAYQRSFTMKIILVCRRVAKHSESSLDT